MSTTYTIKSGNHYSTWLPSITFRDFVEFEATFSDSCRYQLEGIDAYDINKLAGISTSLNHHHQSARLGFRCIDNTKFQLLPYTYVSGVRVTTDTVLAVVAVGEKFRCRIEDHEVHYSYHLWVSSGYSYHEVPKSPDYLWFNFKWKLKPFFGGNRPAPHLMTIFLKWL